MYRFYENRNHDPQSNGELRLLKQIARISPKIIFDVGANVGNYAELVIRTNPQVNLYCFEPVSATFENLERNLGKHSNKRILALKKGLFKENISHEINIYPGHEHASLFDIRGIDHKIVKRESIELITFDSFVEQQKIEHVDFVKLDLEGAEMDAIKGMHQSLLSKKIRAIQFEYGYINITSKNLLADYYDFFKAYDYILGKIYPKTVEFRDYKFKHEDFIGPNFLAVQKNDKELIELLR
ncbi:MAG: FkbM family methyltransferase [Cyclobacteriaceae bacterium]|nr:FkbM family methyltransferase [Cyclobacteriaceae bacterium]